MGARSIVELTLNHFFERSYSSLFRAVNEFYKPRTSSDFTQEALLASRQEVIVNLQKNFVSFLPEKNCYHFALDCTSISRLYAKTLQDKQYCHQYTAVPGQKPVTVGHHYSVLCYLEDDHWALPLCLDRVKSDEDKTMKGVQQLTKLSNQDKFKMAQLICCADSAYCSAAALCETYSHKNIIFISRLKNNRVVYKAHKAPEKRGRGRPRKYGDICHLGHELGQPNEETILTEKNKKGKAISVDIKGWDNFLLRGKRQYSLEDKTLRIIKITLQNDQGQAIYRYPLWLCVSGVESKKLSLGSIHAHYRQRFDIEYFFKFGKTKLLMSDALTPDVEHAENWMQFVMIGMHMLYHAKSLSELRYRPWESKKCVSRISKTPFQTFRCMPEIIADIGTPAASPKLRGIPLGRAVGDTRKRRPIQPIICKTKSKKDELSIKLGFCAKRGILKIPINSSEGDAEQKVIDEATLFKKIKSKIEHFGVCVT